MNRSRLGVVLGFAALVCTVQAAAPGDSQMEELLHVSARLETELIRVNGVAAGLPLRNKLDRRVEHALHMLEREARAFNAAVAAYFDRSAELQSAFDHLDRAGAVAAKLVAARGAHRELKQRWPELAGILTQIASYRESKPAAARRETAPATRHAGGEASSEAKN